MPECTDWVAWQNRRSRGAHTLNVEGRCTVDDPGLTVALRRAVPQIAAPVAVAREGGPPTFHLEMQPDHFFAIEIALDRPELLDIVRHGDERSEANFIATWHSALLPQTPAFTLPDGIWQQVRGADRLYYRLCISTSPTEWRDFEVTTRDQDAAHAPFAQLVDTATRDSEVLNNLTLRYVVEESGDPASPGELTVTARFTERAALAYAQVTIQPGNIVVPVETQF